MSPVLANWGSRVIVGRQEICRKCHLCIPAISYIMCKICDTCSEDILGSSMHTGLDHEELHTVQ